MFAEVGLPSALLSGVAEAVEHFGRMAGIWWANHSNIRRDQWREVDSFELSIGSNT